MIELAVEANIKRYAVLIFVNLLPAIIHAKPVNSVVRYIISIMAIMGKLKLWENRRMNTKKTIFKPAVIEATRRTELNIKTAAPRGTRKNIDSRPVLRKTTLTDAHIIIATRD
jgi:hypothetical protein